MLELLVVLVLFLVLAILVISFRLSGRFGKISLDQETVKGAIATCWKELGIDQDIGAIKARANDIQIATQNLESLFKVTRGRGEYGEFQLEQILKDILPTQYLHIRKRIPKIGKMTNEEKNDIDSLRGRRNDIIHATGATPTEGETKRVMNLAFLLHSKELA